MNDIAKVLLFEIFIVLAACYIFDAFLPIIAFILIIGFITIVLYNAKYKNWLEHIENLF